MIRNKALGVYVLIILSFTKMGVAFGQAPNISYATPKVYAINTTISPLAPANSGGAVTSNAYGQVSTFAGNGSGTSSDGVGTNAGFIDPYGVVVDTKGNVYVSDNPTSIRKITPDGNVITFAGGNTSGFADGQGTAAGFTTPVCMAFDKTGNLFVADFGNGEIRKITPDGTVSTYAGSHLNQTSVNGNLSTARFYGPYGIVFDSHGNMFISETSAQDIKKIDVNGNVTTFAGVNGTSGNVDGPGVTAEFNGPGFLAIDASDNLYMTDMYNNSVRKITPAGVVSTLAGGPGAGFVNGQGNNARFNEPLGIAVDAAGNVYVADVYSYAIRKITPAGVVSTVAGTGSAGSQDGTASGASFNLPQGLAYDGLGNLYVADGANYTIRKVPVSSYTIDKPLPPGLVFNTTTGIISGTPTATSPATNYTVTAYNPSGKSSTVVNIAVNNNVAPVLPTINAPQISYVTPQVYKVNITIASLNPTNNGGAVQPNNYGETIFAGSGAAGSTNGNLATASFNNVSDMVFDPSGNAYIADANNHLIRKIIPGGTVSTFAGSGSPAFQNGQGTAASFNFPTGIATDAAGNVYVADQRNNAIRKITPGGLVSTLAGSGTAGAFNALGTLATFNAPFGVAVDASGNVYVADSGNSLIREISPGGLVTTFAGSGTNGSNNGNGTGASFYSPQGIAIDAIGNIYIGDTGNNLIRKISPAGNVITLAGSGSIGSADGQGTAATFYGPTGLCTDKYGNVYVADTFNDHIRKIDPNGKVTTVDILAATGVASDGKGSLYFADIFTNQIVRFSLNGYTIDKPLPPGLIFDGKTGIITGTPTAASPATNYTVTAYNEGGSSSTIVNIEVKPNSVPVTPLPNPPVITYTTPNVYTAGAAITALLPANTGGSVPATPYGQASVFAGNGTKGSTGGNGMAASFNSPPGVATDAAGNIYVADRDNYLIRKITPSGTVSVFAGNGIGVVKDGQGTAASFKGPEGIATDANGNVYVADTYGDAIRVITPGGLVTTIAGANGIEGDADGPVATATFNQPQGIVVDASGNIYISEYGVSYIRKIGTDGMVTTIAGNGTAGFADGKGRLAIFNNPQKLAVDAAGNVYVADFYNNRVRKVTPDGTVTTIISNNADFQFMYIGGVAVDALGNIYFSDTGNNRIMKYDKNGKYTVLSDGINSGGLNLFNFPLGLSLDATGNLYVANFGASEIMKVPVTGFTIDKPLPAGLTFDQTTGKISGTPTAISPATDYTVTAYNTGGSSSFTLSIKVDAASTITFNPIPQKTVCDVDFDPGATSTAAPVTYASSNTAVATVVAGKVHITGAGTSDITAADGTNTLTQTLTVTAPLIPTVTISPVSADDCAGTTVTYTATATNGGTAPSYQWFVNGQNSGVTGPVFMSSTLSNNDKITCVLTSNAVCTSSPTATSNQAVFVLDAPVTATITITSSATGSICAGTPVTFTATVSTPDANPVFQWMVNGNNAGSNSATFTGNALNNGDIVTCQLVSNGKCLVNPNATSNPIVITLSPASACLVIVPNTFTPNGDGINDVWNITALQNYPGCTVTVYTRYGTQVFRATGYPKPWDGTRNGKTLPVGTYYYLIDLKTGKTPLSGFLAILR
jgi:gliding motility-associated-like protein